MIFVCYFQKKHILELLANTSARNILLVSNAIPISFGYICILHCQFDKFGLLFFWGKLNTNLQLNINMKVNSNLSHVSSSHKGSVVIPLEFPSRIIWSTHWFYKLEKFQEQFIFSRVGYR